MDYVHGNLCAVPKGVHIMGNYYSYEEIETQSLEPGSCCECMAEIAPGALYWFLSCKLTKKAKKYDVYHTCEECHDARVRFCQEGFTPSGLLANLEGVRAKLSYDDASNWSLITHALACLRTRLRFAGPVPPYTPTPLNGPRCVRGGFAG